MRTGEVFENVYADVVRISWHYTFLLSVMKKGQGMYLWAHSSWSTQAVSTTQRRFDCEHPLAVDL